MNGKTENEKMEKIHEVDKRRKKASRMRKGGGMKKTRGGGEKNIGTGKIDRCKKCGGEE